MEARINYISLKQWESYNNRTVKRQEIQISYINALGYRQTSFKHLNPGESITKTQHSTIVHIFDSFI